jgi:DNA-binding response OmpR family regulator
MFMEEEFGKIFLVDDNPVNLRAGKNVLSDEYEVFTAPSAVKMFELLQEIKPSLILLDIEMPQMDGYEALKLLKSRPETAAIPVIFLTGKTDEENEKKGLALGAADYIKKPFDPDELRSRIGAHIQTA